MNIARFTGRTDNLPAAPAAEQPSTPHVAAAPTPSTAPAATPAVVEARDLVRTFRRGADEIRAVDHVSFTIAPGEFTAIVGPSGAGKTTLLQLIGCMDRPTSGSLLLAGRETSRLTDGELTKLRRDHIGFVFQHFGLLPTLTVAENVAVPAMFRGRRERERVRELLETVGLAHRAAHRPSQLSGGEMQRTAIARALINSPRLLLADEPTGNLDSATSASVIDLLRTLNADGLTLVVVTHNEALAALADRRIDFRDGKIAG